MLLVTMKGGVFTDLGTTWTVLQMARYSIVVHAQTLLCQLTVSSDY